MGPPRLAVDLAKGAPGSCFFHTLHDEPGRVGSLGRGTHYSVLRAVIWEPEPRFHDFAVIWDEDHDTRIIGVLEQLYVRRLSLRASPSSSDQPAERQCQRWARTGVEFAPQTLRRRIAAHIKLLMPLAQIITERARTPGLLGSEATGIPILDPDVPEGVRSAGFRRARYGSPRALARKAAGSSSSSRWRSSLTNEPPGQFPPTSAQTRDPATSAEVGSILAGANTEPNFNSLLDITGLLCLLGRAGSAPPSARRCSARSSARLAPCRRRRRSTR